MQPPNQPYQPPRANPYQAHSPYAQPPPEPPKTSGMAVAALISTFLCMPVGLVLSIIALSQINGSQGRLKGQGLAIAALVLSLVFGPVMVLAAIAIPNFVRYQLKAKQSEARTNLGGIRTAMHSFYATEDGFLTIGATPDTLPGTVKAPFAINPCPSSCSRANLRACNTFECIGFRPAGDVQYSYACEASADGNHFTCAALGDLDGDGNASLFVYGTGEGSSIVAPIPDFGGYAPPCGYVFPNEVVDCTPGVY